MAFACCNVCAIPCPSLFVSLFLFFRSKPLICFHAFLCGTSPSSYYVTPAHFGPVLHYGYIWLQVILAAAARICGRILPHVTGISNENDDMDITSLLWLHLGPFCFGWVITGGLMMAALSLLGETETRVGAPGC
jgi:hypothetical protein